MAKTEKLEILIDSETLEYQIDIEYCSVNHIREVCEDIIRRIDNGEFHRPDLIVPSKDEDEERNEEKDLLDFIYGPKLKP